VGDGEVRHLLAESRERMTKTLKPTLAG